jgi:hypothetical protein
MVSRRWLVPAFALLCFAAPLVAQAPKSRNPVEASLKASRLEVPEGVNSANFARMRNGNVALDPPTEADLAVLEGVARQLVYPVTHFEYYTVVEPVSAELSPRPDEKTVGRLITDLRGRLLPIAVGDLTVPAPKVNFTREFGKALVKAIDDVLAKSPPPVVRMNAVRMLGVVAESGAPAATERITKLLAEKDKGLPVEALYYGLKAAEDAIAMYDPGRSAVGQNWVTKNMFFDLVSLVDDVVLKVPAVVAEKTYQPDQGGAGELVTDPKAPPKPAPTALTPEQVATVQMFRLQAVRALGKVRADIVYDDKKERQRRPLLTLAKVAMSDSTLVPPPSQKEVAEAVGGLATAVPTDIELDAAVLSVAMAKGVKDFVTEKVSAERKGDTGPQAAHWKLTGARLKDTFTKWEKAVANTRIDKASKDLLREFSQVAITQVFDPLSRQADNGVVTGLKPEAIDEWLTKRMSELKALQLYKDLPTAKLNPR